MKRLLMIASILMPNSGIGYSQIDSYHDLRKIYGESSQNPTTNRIDSRISNLLGSTHGSTVAKPDGFAAQIKDQKTAKAENKNQGYVEYGGKKRGFGRFLQYLFGGILATVGGFLLLGALLSGLIGLAGGVSPDILLPFWPFLIAGGLALYAGIKIIQNASKN